MLLSLEIIQTRFKDEIPKLYELLIFLVKMTLYLIFYLFYKLLISVLKPRSFTKRIACVRLTNFMLWKIRFHYSVR